MASLFRKLGKKSDKSPSRPRVDLENKSPTGLRKTPVTTQPMPNPNNNVQAKEGNGYDAEEPREFPIPISRKKERNMSISKSGRHKFKGKQRGSVMSQEIYNGGPSSKETTTSPSGASQTRGPWGDAPLSLSTSQPTSV